MIFLGLMVTVMLIFLVLGFIILYNKLHMVENITLLLLDSIAPEYIERIDMGELKIRGFIGLDWLKALRGD